MTGLKSNGCGPAASSLRTLLVIDDHASVRVSLEYMLSLHGYRVLVAASGPEGIALAARNPPDAALVDLHMEPMDGCRTIQQLLADAKAAGREIPVWIMTAAYTPMAEQAAKTAGALGLLTKPFNYPELFAHFERRFEARPRAPI